MSREVVAMGASLVSWLLCSKRHNPHGAFCQTTTVHCSLKPDKKLTAEARSGNSMVALEVVE